MTRNPCKNCKYAFVYKGRHMHGWECHLDCDKYRKHQEYLERKRIFRKGDVIKSIEELLNCEWVMWGDKPRHIEVIKCMQLNSILRFIQLGYFNKAVRKEVDNE